MINDPLTEPHRPHHNFDRMTQCTQCGMYTIVGTSVPLIHLNDVGTSGILTRRVLCMTCGWKGNELYDITFNRIDPIVEPKKKITPTVRMFPLESSAIKKVGYDNEEKYLYIQFTSSDTIYGYKDVYSEEFIGLINSNNPGRYYSNNIKGTYDRL